MAGAPNQNAVSVCAFAMNDRKQKSTNEAIRKGLFITLKAKPDLSAKLV